MGSEKEEDIETGEKTARQTDRKKIERVIKSMHGSATHIIFFIQSLVHQSKSSVTNCLQNF